MTTAILIILAFCVLSWLLAWGCYRHQKAKIILKDRLRAILPNAEIDAWELRKIYNSIHNTDVSIALFHMALSEMAKDGQISSERREGHDGNGLRRYVARI